MWIIGSMVSNRSVDDRHTNISHYIRFWAQRHPLCPASFSFVLFSSMPFISHTVGFLQCFYTAFSVISRLLSIFSLHSTAKNGKLRIQPKKYEIVCQFTENHIKCSFLLFVCFFKLGFMPLLCKRKDVKGLKEWQCTVPRGRYEPYWT